MQIVDGGQKMASIYTLYSISNETEYTSYRIINVETLLNTPHNFVLSIIFLSSAGPCHANELT